GNKRLECVLTVRAGQVVYERHSRPGGSTDTQVYDILIKHGQLRGTDNQRDEDLDVGVAGGRITRVGRRLPAAHARLVIEAEGYEVRPTDSGAGPCGAIAEERPQLSEGRTADLALLESVGGEKRCVLGIRGGRVIWDRDGLSISDVSRAGPYSNFK
ncbi:MAG TPA: hypothetical protein VGH38_07330, partial [Bryobacteraceae bacterium]